MLNEIMKRKYIDNILQIAGKEVMKTDASFKDKNLEHLNYEGYLKLSEDLQGKVKEIIDRLIKYSWSPDFSSNLKKLKGVSKNFGVRSANDILNIKVKKAKHNSYNKKKKASNLIKTTLSVSKKVFSVLGKTFQIIPIVKSGVWVLIGVGMAFAPRFIPVPLLGAAISYSPVWWWSCGLVGTLTSLYNIGKISAQIDKIKQSNLSNDKKKSKGEKKAKEEEFEEEVVEKFSLPSKKRNEQVPVRQSEQSITEDSEELETPLEEQKTVNENVEVPGQDKPRSEFSIDEILRRLYTSKNRLETCLESIEFDLREIMDATGEKDINLYGKNSTYTTRLIRKIKAKRLISECDKAIEACKQIRREKLLQNIFVSNSEEGQTLFENYLKLEDEFKKI